MKNQNIILTDAFYIPDVLLDSNNSAKAEKATKYKTLNAIMYLKPSLEFMYKETKHYKRS